MSHGTTLARLFAGLATLALAASAALSAASVTSPFATTVEGWLPVKDVSLYWSESGGMGGGYLKGIDQEAGSVWYFGAPPKFLGDKSLAYGLTLTYALRQSNRNPDLAGLPDVVLRGAGRVMVIATAVPGNDWTQFSVRLDEAAGWRLDSLDGATPTEQEMKAVLADLTALEIRGEFHSQWDRADLDNVVMNLQGDASRVYPIPCTFDTGDQGWVTRGDTQTLPRLPTYNTSGGNPGGCISAVDVETDIWYFVAPLVHLGDVSGAYGRDLTWDMRQSATDSQIDGADVILTGETLTLVADAGPSPGTAWTSYKVKLDPSGGWRVGALGGPVATEAQVRSVLAALNALRLRGEFRSGEDTGWLDNVLFGVGPLRYGDANADDVVDMTDVHFTLRAAAGLQDAGRLAAIDVAPKPSDAPSGYGDGKVTVADACRILRFVSGSEPSLP